MKNPALAARDLYSKLPKETVRYVIAGCLTTLLAVGVFKSLITLGITDISANRISIAVAVLFAYIINKLFVFKRRTGSFSAFVAEFFKFLGGRSFTAVLEMFGYPVLIKLLPLFPERETIAKALTTVVVFVLNYIISKLFVFRRKQSNY